MWTEVSFCVFILVVNTYGGEVAEWSQQREKAGEALFNAEQASWGVALLQKEADKGNPDAESDLTLARLLGAGLTQDIEGAAESSYSLVSTGGARAHTTLALLLSHNLTDTFLTEDERKSQALSHYLLAAMNKDPLAQILVGRHYWSIGDCNSALQYLRKVAMTVVPTAEEEINMRPTDKFIWPEDDVLPEMYQLPSLDEFQYLEYSARNGDEEAAMQAAIVMYRGLPGLQYDPELHAHYLRQAAEGNITTAMALLAAFHLYGRGEADRNDTMELLQTALENDDLLAHTYLGLLYMKGFKDIPKDLEKAKHHLEEGVKAGTVEAFYLLGKLYADPEGPGTIDDAIPLWEVPASFGHVISAFRIAEIYYKRMEMTAATTVSADGFSAVADNMCKKTLPLYRMIALSGKWRGLLDAAYEDYINGRLSAALLKYLLMSDLGYTSAHINAGRLLESGTTVYNCSDSSYSEALKVWQRAADASIPTGHLRLGDLHYYGQGVPRDLTAAVKRYQEAAKLGNAEGMFNVALMYEWGKGVDQNVTEARSRYLSAYDMSPDAFLPVVLAVGKMDVLLGIHAVTGLDMYAVDWSNRISEISNFVTDLLRNCPPWDITFMLALLILILIMVRMRRH